VLGGLLVRADENFQFDRTLLASILAQHRKSGCPNSIRGIINGPALMLHSKSSDRCTDCYNQ